MSHCVAVAVLVAYRVTLAHPIAIKVKVCLGTGFVGLCRRTLERKLVLKAEMMAVLQPEGRGHLFCVSWNQLRWNWCCLFCVNGEAMSALQCVIAQKERKDSNPELDLVGFSCCDTMQCSKLWS